MLGTRLNRKANEALARHVDVDRFSDMTLKTEGGDIYARYSEHSSAGPQRPVMVLVHGLGLSHRYMMPTAQALMKDYSVYVPDLPGFGDSYKPRHTLNVDGLADGLAAWVRTMQFEAPVVLLGNSFACQVILAFLDRHPQLASSAVLQGPTTPHNERTWRQQYKVWRKNTKYNPPEMDPISFDDYRKAGLVRVLRTFNYALKDRSEDRLPRIKHPILVIRGECDPICHQWWAEEIAAGLPNGRAAEIPGVAHTLVFTAPEQLAHATRTFLDELQLGKR